MKQHKNMNLWKVKQVKKVAGLILDTFLCQWTGDLSSKDSWVSLQYPLMDGWKVNYHNYTWKTSPLILMWFESCEDAATSRSSDWLQTAVVCVLCDTSEKTTLHFSSSALTQNGHKPLCTKLVWCWEPLSCISGWRWDSLAVNTRAGDWGLCRLTAGEWLPQTQKFPPKRSGISTETSEYVSVWLPSLRNWLRQFLPKPLSELRHMAWTKHTAPVLVHHGPVISAFFFLLLLSPSQV